MSQDSHNARVEQQIIELYSLIGHQIERIIRRDERTSDFIIKARDGEKRVTRCEVRDEVNDTHVKALYQVMRDEGAAQAALITTGSLSVKAQRFAKGKPIRLVDWSEFESLLLRARAQAQKKEQTSTTSPIQSETLKPQAEADTPPAKQHDTMEEHGNRPRRLSFATRGWRMLNTGILLFAFFAPWMSSCSMSLCLSLSCSASSRPPYAGWEVTILSFIDGLSRSKYDAMITGLAGTIGGICLLVYALTNFVRAMTGNRPHSNRRLRIPLIGCVVGLASVLVGPLLGHFSETTLLERVKQHILWGYWLTWGGVLSSAIVEALDSRAAKWVHLKRPERKT